MEEGWLKDVVGNDTFIMERFEPSWQSEPELQSVPGGEVQPVILKALYSYNFSI